MLTILWHDVESAGYTDHIRREWISSEGTLSGVTHIVSGPRSGKYKAKCNIIVKGKCVDFDYEAHEQFNTNHDMYPGVMRVQFSGADRQSVVQVLWKDRGNRQFLPCSTSTAFVSEEIPDLDAQVSESTKLTSAQRLKLLLHAPKEPIRKRVVSEVFVRNPHVVAEVLFRSKGICGMCTAPAPFKRANTGIPYLEVHHIKRLADGGHDTLENTIAVCPNCHRREHYG